MALRHIHLDLDLFRNSHNLADRERSQNSILWFLEALTQVNVLFFRTYPNTPRLYQSNVVYDNMNMEEEAEHWKDVSTTLEDGKAVCGTLACYRAAELWAFDNIHAHPFLRWRRMPDDSLRYHALVRWPAGRIEDPSKALGMGGPIIRRPVFVGTYGSTSIQF